MTGPTHKCDALNAERIDRAAAALFRARTDGQLLEGLAPDCVPSSLGDAFAVQRRTTALVGQPIGGWKVGLVPNVRLTFAPIYRPVIYQTPAEVKVQAQPTPVIEAEISFHLGTDLPRRDRPYTPDEVTAAVESAHAAIEVGQPRLGNFYPAPIEHKIADNMGNCALVWGSGTRSWRDLDRTRLEVRVEVDGREVVKLIGGNLAGDPFDALVALANTPLKEEPLLAGQIIITGSCTGMTEATAGSKASISFAGLGSVEVRLI